MSGARAADRQPAITKHLPLTGSYCFRFKFEDGGTWQAVTTRPLAIPELIESLEERIAELRRIDSRVASAGATPLAEGAPASAPRS